MNANLVFRISIYLLLFFLTTLIFTNYTQFVFFKKNEILSLLVSVISIIVAIIVTYLFSKLFSEKAIKVERKKEIDVLSKKITYLRRIAFLIRGMHDFWRFRNTFVNVNIKATIDSRYSDLTYEEYRGYNVPGHRQFTNEEREQIDIDISGTDGQAYLALKGLEDMDSTYTLYREFNPKNYSLADIERFREYSNSFWYFLDRSDRDVYDFRRVNRYYLTTLDELYYKIMGKPIDATDYRGEVRALFSHFEEEIFQKHSFLNKLNSDVFPQVFRKSFFNLLVFICLLILSLILFTIDGDLKVNYISTLFLLSLFISNTVDLIIITFQSIISELYVNDVYDI